MERRREEKKNEYTCQHGQEIDHILVSRTLSCLEHTMTYLQTANIQDKPPHTVYSEQFCKLTLAILLRASWDFTGQK